jgi:rfaE bifunctional protein nucleotidyltransferase chain/domain
MSDAQPLIHPKILSLKQAVEKRDVLRQQGKRVVLTNGCFDLLHPGHCHALRQARLQGDALFVLLNSDESIRYLKGPDRPILREDQRAFSLACQESVDAVILFSSERATDEILKISPDLYCKSGDYSLDTLNKEERAALEQVGADIRFIPFLAGFSTTSLLEKIRHGKMTSL